MNERKARLKAKERRKKEQRKHRFKLRSVIEDAERTGWLGLAGFPLKHQRKAEAKLSSAKPTSQRRSLFLLFLLLAASHFFHRA